MEMYPEEIPTLADLALPFEGAEAQLNGISVSVSLIAATPPAQLRDAIQEAGETIYQAQERSAETSVSDAWQHYADVVKTVKEADNIQEHRPAVNVATAKLVEEFIAEIEQSTQLEALRETGQLNVEICQDLQRLSHRGCHTTMALGALLGAGISLGIIHAYAAHESDVQAGMLSSQGTEQVMENRKVEAMFKVVPTAMGALLGFGAGFAVANKRAGHYAQRCAKSMVRKAQKHPAI